MVSPLAHMTALPCQRQIDSLWNRLVVASDGDEPARLVMRQLMCYDLACSLPAPAIRGRNRLLLPGSPPGVLPVSYPEEVVHASQNVISHMTKC